MEHIPTDGPVILVGNHHNQFVDPAIVLTQTPREVRFLIAAKSLKRVVVGFFARMLRSIPVSRPNDLASKGQGTVSYKVGSNELRGKGTKFQSQVKVGDLLSFRGLTEDGSGSRVDEVKGDDLVILGQPFEQTFTDLEYKVIPKIDQAALYTEVTKSLSEGTCICLFPEGGSHDRPDLLPLKAGVAVMALAAMASMKKENKDTKQRVNIVPCGLNYFHGHRFRSHVLVEYGKPVEVSDELMELYEKDKRAACSELLQMVEKRMKAVTVLAPDLQTLQAILIGRRIYQPDRVELTADKYLELNRRFTETYLHFKDEPRVQRVLEKTLEYKEKLHIWGLHDYQVSALPPLSTGDRYILLLGRVIVLALLGMLALPGIILNLPVGIAARTLAHRHAKQALAASNVKVSGRDVISSYKILVAMVLWPLIHMFYAAVVVYMAGWKWGIISWFVLFPLYAYSTVRIFEIGMDLWRANLPLFLSLLPGGDKYHKQLLVMREDIKNKLKTLAEELGPKMPFWNDRILTDAVFLSSSSSGPAPPSRVSYVKKDKKKSK